METAKVDLLRRAMQTYTMRMQATASNLANIDTPGYQRMSVTFEDQLQKAIHHGAGARTPEDVEPTVEMQDAPPVLEDELMEMSDTQMRTQLATRALRDHFEMMRMGITGRAG